MPTVQRGDPAGPPTAADGRDDRLSRARGELRWADAARVLDEFPDVDLRARAQSLTVTDRGAIRSSCPPELHRVRGALLAEEWNLAVAAKDWMTAAVTVNGFDDRGIRERVAALDSTVLTDFADAAVRAMSGVSRSRVLDGIRARYETVSTDPLGTRTLTVVGLMREAGMPDAAALAYTRLCLNVRTVEGAGTEAGSEQLDRTLATAMGAAFVPKGPQPPALAAGNLAHQMIGGIYESLNPLSFYDLPAAAYIARVATKFRVRGGAADLFTNVDMRPDIVDLPRLEVFEIKPLGSQGLAVGEALDYVSLLNGLLVDAAAGFRPGSPGNPGTTGVLPFADQGRPGVLVWGCPVPGAILYAFVNQMIESPEHVREQINQPAGAGAGVESMVALGMAGVAALAVAPQALGAAAVGYEGLIAALARAAQVAGQPIPRLVGAAAAATAGGGAAGK
ncbi:hypothetical protein E4V99_12290 [Microbacterium sp. dk485]|uniref:hypothetical protein n=1 Tax=Microbacterium sp. dk485 TaxID=2560021 RepID=UPI00107364A4|nr:hypothetical protein [Microbacterium sp. dk485]TFV81743.1 hypothetical protein E4V99_12290 [Microbacterium sp. dk485]